MFRAISRINWSAVITETSKGVVNLSLGRVAFWLCFGLMFHFWLITIEVPATLMTVFLSLLSYNLGKKVQTVVEGYFGTKNDRTLEP